MEENTGVNLQDLELGNGFWNMTLKVQAINLKKQIKFDLIKTENFCASRTLSEIETAYRVRKNICKPCIW